MLKWKSPHVTLSDILVKYTLRSSDLFLLAVPKTKHKCIGDGVYAAVAPKLWNSLALHTKLSPSVAIFKSNLKQNFHAMGSLQLLFFKCALLIHLYYITLFYLHFEILFILYS